MYKNNDKMPKILAVLLIVLVSVCAVLSAVFGALNYRRSYKAEADTVVEYPIFTSSDLYFIGQYMDISWALDYPYTEFVYDYDNMNTPEQFRPCSLSFVFQVDENLDDMYYINCDRCSMYYYTNTGNKKVPLGFCSGFDDIGNGFVPIMQSELSCPKFAGDYSKETFFTNEDDGFRNPYPEWMSYEYSEVCFLTNQQNQEGVFEIACFYTGNFDLGNVMGVNLFSRYCVEEIDAYCCYYINVLEYFDNNDDKLVVILFNAFGGNNIVSNENIKDIYPEIVDRTYWFDNAFKTYDNRVSSAYNNGKQAGIAEGDSVGYTRGYKNGVKQGEITGYNRGVADANNYSFFGLISAVVDAPIQAFTGLLNFNLLGFNMLNFFTGLLTLGLILWIVGKILGSK